MSQIETLSREQLIQKVNELQTLLDAMKADKDTQELLKFPWVGNLGHWYWYYKTNRVICNEQKLIALGYTKEEIPAEIGFEFFTERLHPDDYGRVMENMRDHLYGKSLAYETSYRIQTRQNQWIWFYDRGTITKCDENGKPELISGIVFDITEEKRMEEQLARQNQQLLEMSATDYLTNVFNRRALFDKLDYEMRRKNRHQRPLSVAMLDIDHFKQINDTRGHLMGDRVLTKVAAVIKQTLRNTDIVGRYGGEEFLVILPECNQFDAIRVAEKIRWAVQAVQFEDSLRVTISGGVVEFKHNETADQLIEKADQLLYQAKKNGRNRIEFP
jgi:diguanylate cyclase